MSMDYAVETIKALTKEIKDAGFRVFIAESGTYGFYTDTDGSRIISFQVDGWSGVRFSGNYTTSNPRKTGTGWVLETDTFSAMFNQQAPRWAVGNATWRYTTLAENLATYQPSSKYKEVL